MRIRAAATALALACGMAVVASVETGAFDRRLLDRRSGPPWWMPENNDEWSRHHDRWRDSPVEVAQQGAWTSFSAETWVYTDQFGYSTQAPWNTACDLVDGRPIMNVGPPLRDEDYVIADGNAPTRKPQDASGGIGGLQISLHIGEWWQGLKFVVDGDMGVSGVGHVEASWTNGYHLPLDWQPHQYGFFTVGTRNWAGRIVSPFRQWMGNWVRFPHPAADRNMMLTGGSSTMGCIGAALVMMHGVESDHHVYPKPMTGSDGSECYSLPRLFVLRANTEMRCEPDLERRYEMTEEFWAWFENFQESRVDPDLAARYGPTRYAEFPRTYEGPYTWVRRGEYGLFTADEEAGAQLAPVPWETPAWSNLADPEDRRREVDRLADPATRPDLLAGDTITLQNNFSGAAQLEECIELGAAGWTAETGTFDPQCERYGSPVTGLVNHEENRALTVERKPEVGWRDNRSPFSPVATARRLVGSPSFTVPGYDWFQHQKAAMGCVSGRKWLRNLPEEARIQMRSLLASADYIKALRKGPCPSYIPPEKCQDWREALMDTEEGLRQDALGWRGVLRHRMEQHPRMMAATAWYGADPTWLWYRGRGGGGGALQNEKCYTGPIGGGGFNERLGPVSYTHGLSVPGAQPQPMVDGWSGRTWYDTDVQDDMWWTPAGRGTAYHPHTEVRGSVTPRAREAARAVAGVAEPYPRDLNHDYSDPLGPRAGSYTYREFACPTSGIGFYGAGVRDLGPETLDHRSAPPGQAWRLPNAGPGGRAIDRTNPESRYPTATPCIEDGPGGAATSELTGEPLADYYNVRGRAAADVEGDEKCQPSSWDATEQAWLADPNVAGYYSSPDVPGGNGAEYELQYSGDGQASILGRAREEMTRPASYRVEDEDAWIAMFMNEQLLGRSMQGTPGGEGVVYSVHQPGAARGDCRAWTSTGGTPAGR